MAIQLPISYKWFDINSYNKITWISYYESGKDEEGKIYKMNVLVNSYTNEYKEYDIEQKNYSFECRYNELNIDSAYIKLKSLDEFKNGVDI